MKTLNPQLTRSVADSVGIISSALCALHCLVVPTMLILGTTVPASLLDNETFHSALLWLILPSAVVAFALGCRRHKDALVLALGLCGLVGVTLAVTLVHDLLGENAERIVTLVSTVLLVSAHSRNFALCRQHHCDHGPH